jgi:hypothetical protein
MAGHCENLQPLQVKYFTVAAKGSQLAALADALTRDYGYGVAGQLSPEKKQAERQTSINTN